MTIHDAFSISRRGLLKAGAVTASVPALAAAQNNTAAAAVALYEIGRA